MSNIEIYGTYFATESSVAFHLMQANCSAISVRKTLERIFADWPCAEDLVITTIISEVRDLNGKNQPYLRVWETDAEEGRKIALRLRLEGFKVELPPPTEFFPKPIYSMKEIATELRQISNTPEAYETALQGLLGGDSKLACDFFRTELASDPYCSLVPPISAELEIKLPPVEPHNFSMSAIQYRLIRWTQMLAILGE